MEHIALKYLVRLLSKRCMFCRLYNAHLLPLPLTLKPNFTAAYAFLGPIIQALNLKRTIYVYNQEILNKTIVYSY